MADKLHLFSTTDAERIAKAVKSIESQAQKTMPTTKREPLITGNNGFWARITGRDYTDKTYAWTKIIPQDDQTWDDDADVSGTTTDKPAREVNDFVFVPTGSRVFLRSRHDYYVFEWEEYIVLGITDAAITSGSTGTVSVYFDTTDTTQNITAKNRGTTTLPSSSKVTCVLLGSSWFIVSGGGGGSGTRIVKGALTAALADTDANASVGSIVSYSSESAPSVTSASNLLKKSGPSGAACLIIVDDATTTPAYILLDVALVGLDVQVDTDTSGTALRKKRRKFSVYTKDTSDTTTTVDSGTTCA